jgi:hypothetical protein
VLLQARSQQQGDASPGSWSEEDEQEAVSPSTAGGLPGSHLQHHAWVYQHTEVLLALVTCLQQLGEDKAAVKTVLTELPALPEQLLQLMLASRMRDQQDVLEQLLPVLVMFRQGVLPLLQAPDRQNASSVAAGQEQQHMQETEQQADEQLAIQEHVEVSAVVCLCYWVCIAGVLCDCGPESLDAIDAAWYLLAAVSPGAEGLLQLLLQSSNSGGGVSHMWFLKQARQLNRCIDGSGSKQPESSVQFACRAERVLHSALTRVQAEAANETAL